MNLHQSDLEQTRSDPVISQSVRTNSAHTFITTTFATIEKEEQEKEKEKEDEEEGRMGKDEGGVRMKMRVDWLA